MAQLVKNSSAMGETWVQSLDWENPLRRERLPTLVFLPGKATVHGVIKSWTRLSDFHFYFLLIDIGLFLHLGY